MKQLVVVVLSGRMAMLKMLITLNHDKIGGERKYNASGMEQAICTLFENAGFHRIVDDTDSVIYEGSNSSRDFGMLGRIVNTLKRQKWFMENVTEWRLYDNDSSDDSYDYNEEDLLNHYRQKSAAGA